MLDMHKELIKALERNMVETGSLVCLGCGHEHNCSTHGCAILKDAAAAIQTLTEQVEDLQAECAYLNDFEQTQCHHLLERLSEVAAERDTAINRLSAVPSNVPLTLEQLRGMGYEWVWVERIGNGELPKSVLKYINGYGYVLAKHQKVKICDICLFFDDYGKTWLAYRQKPEGSENHV